MLAYSHYSGRKLAIAVDDAQDTASARNMQHWIDMHWYPPSPGDGMHLPCRLNIHGGFADSLGGGARQGSRSVCPEHGRTERGQLLGFRQATSDRIYTTEQLEKAMSSSSYGSGGAAGAAGAGGSSAPPAPLLFGAIVLHSVPGDGRPVVPPLAQAMCARVRAWQRACRV